MYLSKKRATEILIMKVISFHRCQTRHYFQCSRNIFRPTLLIQYHSHLFLMRLYSRDVCLQHPNDVIIFPKLPKVIIRNFARKYVRKISNTENAISHTFLMQRLQSCRSIKEQLVTFDSYTKLTEADISLRRSVHQSVEESLKNHFPNCSVYLTGSTVSGLGLKGCDVDLSFQFLSNGDNQCDFSKGFQESFNYEYLKLSLKEKIKFLQNILNESKITGASKTVSGRCPIVRFSCQNITCDLSIDNKLALHSTSFMLLCNKLDKRVAPLHRFLTYWAKSHKLIGGPFKFKTYAIFLLLLYFLQTRNPPVLPSVECMLEKTGFNNNFNNWSYDICKHLEKFEGSKNSQCIEELLREFFAFYAKFNFSNVICPLTNEIKMPNEFLSKKETVDCKFPMNTISIQDPLDPDWNATSQVCLKFCYYFLKYLRLSYETFNNDEIWLPVDDRWGICYLFNDLSALQSSKRKINSKRIQNG